MMTDRLHDQFMIQIVKEPFDVQIDHPVGPPAPLPRRGDRVQRRSPGSIPVGIGMEVRLHSGPRCILTTICATRSPTVGMPNALDPPLAFGISTSRTGGGK